MSNDITIVTVQKNENTQIRILVSEYHGKDSTHIREFWRHSENEDYMFGKGVAFPYDNIDIVNALIDGLTTIKKALEQGEPLEQEDS